MQWKKHCSSKACQLAGGGARQEGGAGLRGADAGGPHQEPGGITNLADIAILPKMCKDHSCIRV